MKRLTSLALINRHPPFVSKIFPVHFSIITFIIFLNFALLDLESRQIYQNLFKIVSPSVFARLQMKIILIVFAVPSAITL